MVTDTAVTTDSAVSADTAVWGLSDVYISVTAMTADSAVTVMCSLV